ncbi:MAG: alanyl-tRNA editing protein [Clostridia bacterium]|nr:alanyl-tRNA editing protein [Clostridia bacterium]
MTIRIYEDDVYKKTHKTRVIECIEEGDKKFVVLEETIFFPEGGGQPCDLGKIDNIEVLDVREKGELVLHEMAAFPESDEVVCQLDWERRLDHMQQHCGEHILSGIIYKLYGGVNKGFHMGKDMVTVDIDLKDMSDEMLLEIERASNDVIYKNAPVTTELVHSQEEAAKFPLRKQMTVDSDIRIVQVEGADCVACCGTHPTLAGEVGLIKIFKAEKNKGMTRIYLKCGRRAMDDFQVRHETLTEIMQLYSADLQSVKEKVKQERDKAAAVREELKQLKMAINDRWLVAHLDADKNVIEIFEDKNMDDLKYLTKKMTDSAFSQTLCVGSKQDFGVILASSTVNCGQIFKEHIQNFNGRGGGSPKMAQGSFPSEEDMMNFLNEITVLI